MVEYGVLAGEASTVVGGGARRDRMSHISVTVLKLGAA